MGTRLFTLCGATTDATDDIDDEPWEECLVCEFNGTLKPGRDDM
jgi:hypothetical protein